VKSKLDPDRGGSGTSPEPPACATPAGARALAGRSTAREVAGASRVAQRARYRALESLLDDESSRVQTEVRRAYALAGRKALPALRRAALSDNPRVRSRARALLSAGDRRRALKRVLAAFPRPELDLERALFLLSRYADPGLDLRPYQRALDALAAEVSRRLRSKQDELERALVLGDYLGRELEYGGSIGEFHHPDNIHLHRAIERRAGMPLSLSAIYLFVARRVGIRAAILPLPGHVMLRLHGGSRSVIVDPYHHGRVRTESDCRKYLQQNGLALQSDWLHDAPERLLVQRQVMNLLRSAQMRGAGNEMRDLQLVLRALGARR
jgi:regulator of sirC expression with transglutaminase-like and TPR domain